MPSLVRGCVFLGLMGCAGVLGGNQPDQPNPGAASLATLPSLPPSMMGMRVRVRGGNTDLEKEAVAALETELVRAGVVVCTTEAQTRDVDFLLSFDLVNAALVLEGNATLSAEQNGYLVDRLATTRGVYRRDHLANEIAREVMGGLGKSWRVEQFARTRTIAMPAAPIVATPSPPTENTTPFSSPGVGASPPAGPAPAPSVAVVSAETSTVQGLGKDGRFGLGIGVELNLGMAQSWGDGASSTGAMMAVAMQFDLGPQAAFQLPLAFVLTGAGNDDFGELALYPTFIYRLRSKVGQTIVPYGGLGLRLGSALGGRHLLGRPVTNVATPDSCSRHAKYTGTTRDPANDCSLFASPDPVVGFEWHSGRWLSIDVAARYSFVRFTSAQYPVSWVHVLQLFAGPRITF